MDRIVKRCSGVVMSDAAVMFLGGAILIAPHLNEKHARFASISFIIMYAITTAIGGIL